MAHKDGEPISFEPISRYKYRIPKQGRMRVDGVFYGSKAILEDLEAEHNNAKFEEHGCRRVLVHRKGATRAFGPGEKELPKEYRFVGQPVFVPGDMGRYSFVLAETGGLCARASDRAHMGLEERRAATGPSGKLKGAISFGRWETRG